jgi:hypothetical protein
MKIELPPSETVDPAMTLIDPVNMGPIRAVHEQDYEVIANENHRLRSMLREIAAWMRSVREDGAPGLPILPGTMEFRVREFMTSESLT